MIYVGIDDTDMPGTPGTNQICRALASHIKSRYRCKLIVRHQLLIDDRVPYTSKNSAASLQFEVSGRFSLNHLCRELRAFLGQRFVLGSDPGFCVTHRIPREVADFGRRCQEEIVTQDEAWEIAATHNIHLEGCGGTEDGVIGALAAVGLASTGNDGRVVQIGTWPDDLSGRQEVSSLRARDVVVHCLESGQAVTSGAVDVGKHLRPNYRGANIVLYARPTGTGHSADWQAVRLT